MKTRLAKEARSLFPVWALTLLLPAAPILMWGQDAISVAIGLFCLSSALLGATPFGTEFNHRTIDLLLPQPIPRRQIWYEKMLVLGVALFSAFALFRLGLRWYSPESSAHPFGVLLPFIPLCALAATPCLTLVTRNFIGAVVFSLALPLTILLGGEAWLVSVTAPNSGLDEHAFEEAFHPRLLVYYLLGALGVYGGVMYLLGCLKFKTFEAADRPAGETSLSPVPGGAIDWLLGRIWLGPSGSCANLVRKEFRLQLPSFLIALLFSVLWAIALLIKAMRPETDAAFFIVLMTIYALIMPLIIGALSMAEERFLGMLEWHLTLPFSILKQWTVKLIVTLSLTLVLGLLWPLVLIYLGQGQLAWFAGFKTMPRAELAGLFSLSILITAVAMYASSISGNTLRAVSLAVGLFALGCVLIGLTMSVMERHQNLFVGMFTGIAQTCLPFLRTESGRGILIRSMLLAVPAGLICLILLLSFFNFRCCGLNWRRLWAQALLVYFAAALFFFFLTGLSAVRI
ncbi:MAG: hypothetical protein HY674_16860 [Chloroflexi bacterium]|nr:hypothetical protein [Chloroflexota bacterium]